MTCSNTYSRTWQSVAAGVIAGCVTRSYTSPLDVLKILFQVNQMEQCSILRACRRVYNDRGLRGFWKGNLAGCCRLGPYSGVKFCLYDQLQAIIQESGPLTSIERGVCGALAGMTATLTVYPMELVRTRLIVSGESSSILRELIHIAQVDGVRGLYRGCFTGLIGAIPFEGLQFACYEYGKAYVIENRWPKWRWPQEKQHLQTVDYFALGSVSGGLAQLVSYPFDTVKKRLQMQMLLQGVPRYNGLVDCFLKVIREEGTLSLYRGCTPNMIRLVPYAAVMFASYEAAKDFLQSL